MLFFSVTICACSSEPELARRNDWVLFLHEAQHDHCDPLTVIEVVTHHFRNRCLRQHLLTVSQHLHKQEARGLQKEDSGSKFGDYTEDVDDVGQDNNNTTFATILEVLQCTSPQPHNLVHLCWNKAKQFLSLAIKEQRPMFAILATCCLQPLGWPSLSPSADALVHATARRIQTQSWLVWLAMQVPWSGDAAPLSGVSPPEAMSDLIQGVHECLKSRHEEHPDAFCVKIEADEMESVMGLMSLLMEKHLTSVFNSFRIFSPDHLLFHLYLGVHAFFQRAYGRCGDHLRRFIAAVKKRRGSHAREGVPGVGGAAAGEGIAGASTAGGSSDGGGNRNSSGSEGERSGVDGGAASAYSVESLDRMEHFCECEIARVLQRALRHRGAYECSQWVELVAGTG